MISKKVKILNNFIFEIKIEKQNESNFSEIKNANCSVQENQNKDETI